MVYDRSETDEMGINLTAEEMGLQIDYLPFHKISVAFDRKGFSYTSVGKDFTKELENIRVVLNRTQSKNRRIFSSAIFEFLEKEVVNSLEIELLCESKLRTLLQLSKKGIRIPKTVYVPSNVQEMTPTGKTINNKGIVSKLISKHLGNEEVVLKPDGGTHGRNVMLAENTRELKEILEKITPSITNPAGVLAQEFIPKWFYDLRIVVEKEKGKKAICHETAMARGGFKDFRTNTYLGNMVFRVNLPPALRKQAVNCGEAIGNASEAWVLALDAMPYIKEETVENREELHKNFDALEGPFNLVKKVKRDPSKKINFRDYSEKIEEAYSEFMSTEAYAKIQDVIEDSLDRQYEIFFHEANACPEFWEQTRIVGGVNVAESLLKIAQSLLND
jgi:glutathione synthase/RimK-type ligase-like ATP-grasp enzyme